MCQDIIMLLFHTHSKLQKTILYETLGEMLEIHWNIHVMQEMAPAKVGCLTTR